MNRDDYRTMMEQISLPDESRERIWTEICEKKKPRAKLLRRPLLLAAVILILGAMLVTATAVALRSGVFFSALGEGASQWEEQLSDEIFLTIRTENYSVEISDIFFTVGSINYVATIRPSGTASSEILADFDLALQCADGTAVDFASNVHISLLSRETAAVRYACSHLLDTCVIDESLTLVLSCHIYERVEDRWLGGFEMGRLLASGSAAAAVENVDRAIRRFDGTDEIPTIVLTPVSVLLFGDTENGIGTAIESVTLEFEDGERLVLIENYELQSVCRGAIGNVGDGSASYFVGFKAIDLERVCAVCVNGVRCCIEDE